MTPKLAQLCHTILQKMNVQYLDRMYALLGVKKADDYAPESWYSGRPHPVTGKVLPEKWQIKGMLVDLFCGIAQKQPICKEPNLHCGFIVWPKGNGVPSYYHCDNGIGFHADLEYAQRKSNSNTPCRITRGKLRSTGKYGLGVTYSMACDLWGKDVIDALPIKLSTDD